MIRCQFCNYRIRMRHDVHISHLAMQMASHIMTYHCRNWGEEE
jgi:hypothetical protein